MLTKFPNSMFETPGTGGEGGGGTDAFDVRYFSFTLAGTKIIEGDALYTSFEGEAL